jgi:DNA-binding CsgD family transcriptional regulator/flagellar hook-basal body complex protein FliE
MSFVKYFIERELSGIGDLISESVDNAPKLRKKDLESLMSRLKKKYANYFQDKFPKAQHDDIEEALDDSSKKVHEANPDSESSAKKIFKREAKNILSGLTKKKRKANKNLSCVKAMKIPGSISSLIKRAERMLTSQEKKIIEMCSQGRSVRSIGSELGISAATAWRALNHGLDKIRLSHGIKSRKMG